MLTKREINQMRAEVLLENESPPSNQENADDNELQSLMETNLPTPSYFSYVSSYFSSFFAKQSNHYTDELFILLNQLYPTENLKIEEKNSESREENKFKKK